MGIFSRIGEILNANISSILDKAENPDKTVRLMIYEMEDTLTEVKSSAAQVIAERIRTERLYKDRLKQAASWEEKAALALTREREDLARIAVERRLAYQKEAQQAKADLASLDTMVKQYHQDIANLEKQLKKAHHRQKELTAKRKHAESRKKVEEKIYQANTSSAFAKFEAYSHRIDRLEAELEVGRMRKDEKLAKEFGDLEQLEEVEREIKALKDEMKKTFPK